MFDEITHFFYDFDGVMTDNTAYISEDGSEFVRINRSDGYAVNQLSKLGYEQIIMSTEKNDVVLRRAEKLKISCYHGVSNKKEYLSDFLENKMQSEAYCIRRKRFE